jgi:hypothetical protein
MIVRAQCNHVSWIISPFVSEPCNVMRFEIGVAASSLFVSWLGKCVAVFNPALVNMKTGHLRKSVLFSTESSPT